MELLRCKCHSNEHIIIVDYFEEDDEFYIDIHLTPLSFFERIIHAIKYIFGYRSKYGDFDTIILGSEDINKIINK